MIIIVGIRRCSISKDRIVKYSTSSYSKTGINFMEKGIIYLIQVTLKRKLAISPAPGFEKN
jgi:hypothetical protein